MMIIHHETLLTSVDQPTYKQGVVATEVVGGWLIDWLPDVACKAMAAKTFDIPSKSKQLAASQSEKRL